VRSRQRADELKTELLRPTPTTSRVGSLLASIGRIAEGAAGNLMAAGVLHFLATNPTAQALIATVVGT
jgi:hypothetical protein